MIIRLSRGQRNPQKYIYYTEDTLNFKWIFEKYAMKELYDQELTFVILNLFIFGERAGSDFNP